MTHLYASPLNYWKGLTCRYGCFSQRWSNEASQCPTTHNTRALKWACPLSLAGLMSSGHALRPTPSPNPTREPGIRGHVAASERVCAQSYRQNSFGRENRQCLKDEGSVYLSYFHLDMMDSSHTTNTRRIGYNVGNKWNRFQIYIHRNCP